MPEVCVYAIECRSKDQNRALIKTTASVTMRLSAGEIAALEAPDGTHEVVGFV